MQRMPASNPDRMAFDEGSPAHALLGLPIIAFGMYYAYVSVGPFHIIPFVLGLCVIAFGVHVTLFRRSVTIDRGAGTLSILWGFPFPISRRVKALDDFRTVALTQEKYRRRVDSEDRFIYFIKLQGRGGSIVLDRHYSELAARKSAEKLATFLGIGITDWTSGTPTMRDTAALNESIRQHAARSDKKIEVGALLHAMRSTIEAKGDMVILLMPRPIAGKGFGALIASLILFPVYIVILNVARKEFANGNKWALPFVVFVILSTVLAWLKYATDLIRRSKLIVTSHYLTINDQEGSTTFSCDELKEVRFNDRDNKFALEVISGNKLKRFGDGLSVEELRWIQALILKAITK